MWLEEWAAEIIRADETQKTTFGTRMQTAKIMVKDEFEIEVRKGDKRKHMSETEWVSNV